MDEERPEGGPDRIGVPAGFWDRVRSAAHRLLLLDYDGTLAPFRVDRSSARPLPGVVDVLRRIRESGAARLVIVSGRPVAEVLALTGLDGVAVIGGHGFEVRDESGRWTRHALSPEEAGGLDASEEAARRAGFGDRLERKAASVALHTRGLAPAEARRMEETVRALWTGTPAGDRIECRSFDGGIELRVRGRNKGVAVGELLESMPAGTLAVYVGDDETDEDAFRALKGRGFGFKVGAADAPTAAEGRLADCAAVRAFLERWAETVSPEGGREDR
ncbi:MAG: trehalose-phosphatase [Nitrospinota bacterium]